jgi:hypothetical protein
LRSHRTLLLPFGILFALLIRSVLAFGDLVEGARRFASTRTWEYRESMARETCSVMLMITSSPAPDPDTSEDEIAHFRRG